MARTISESTKRELRQSFLFSSISSFACKSVLLLANSARQNQGKQALLVSTERVYTNDEKPGSGAREPAMLLRTTRPPLRHMAALLSCSESV